VPFKRVLKHRCTGCGTCIDTCSVDVLRRGPDGKAHAAYPKDCMSCFMCTIDCPMDAIEITLFTKRRTPYLPDRVYNKTAG
jgi:NAD-dependent dihydropyrimidine dehydrogenase PreA subunit